MSRSLADPWRLGGVAIPNRAVLAPLAGIGNWFVRLQAKRHGAGLVVSEMVSSFAVHYRNERTCRELLRIHPDEHPVSVLISGGLDSPEHVRAAFEQTGAAGVLLARGSLGNPWLFEQVLGRRVSEPGREEVLAELDWVVDRAVEHVGRERATRYL